VFTGSSFARRTHGLENPNPAPQPFDFSRTPLAAVEFFDASDAYADTRLQKLSTCAPSHERDRMLSEWLLACAKVDEFLAHAADQRKSELQSRREGLWAECRRLEDAKKAAGDSLALSREQLRSRTMALSTLKEAIENARPHFYTSYPTAEETAKIQNYSRESRAQIEHAEAEIDVLKGHAESARIEFNRVSQALFDCNEKLREVDADLNALTKSS